MINQSRLSVYIKQRPVTVFFVLAYLFSWTIWIYVAWVGGKIHQGDIWPTQIPGLFGPFIAAIIVTVITSGRAGLKSLLTRVFKWRVQLRWYIIALSPVIVFGIVYIGQALSSNELPHFEGLNLFSGFPVSSVLVLGVLLTLVNLFGEEAGWRGYAQHTLQTKITPLKTSIIIGLLWGFWHLPLFFIIDSYKLAIFPVFLLGIVSGSIFLSWLFNKSGESVLIVSIWHATYNLFSGSKGSVGVVATAVSIFLVICVIWLLFKDRNLGYMQKSNAK